MAKRLGDYTAEGLDECRRTCLQVAVDLGEFLDDVVLVGGLVPALLVDDAPIAAHRRSGERHPGSLDVDLALRFALLDEDRYRPLIEQLRARGYQPVPNDRGNPRAFKWRNAAHGGGVDIDFLMDDDLLDGDRRILHMGDAFGALRARGVELAFEDFEVRTLEGVNFDGATCVRELRVCGPAAYLVLKVIAFRNRAEEKDAYDLFYVIPQTLEEQRRVAARLQSWRDRPAVEHALGLLAEDFAAPQSTGALAAERFIEATPDSGIATDLAARAQFLLRIVQESE